LSKKTDPLKPTFGSDPSNILKLIIIAVLACIPAAALVSYFYNTSLLTFIPEWFGCPVKKGTGFPCPGCGMSRAFVAIGRGDLKAAFYFHPLSFLLVTIMLAYLVIPSKTLADFFNKYYLNWISGILILVVYILKLTLTTY
jgi:hypothetical protein